MTWFILCRRIAFSVAVLAMFSALETSVQAQRPAAPGAVKIEPYTGDPILLEEGDALPTLRVVEPRMKRTDKYENGEPRIEREVARYSDNTYVSNGSYREFYLSGSVFVEGRYVMGEKTGEWTYYHENGEVAKKVAYLKDQPDGVIEVRRPDGTLQSKRVYKEGKRVGEWITYNEAGDKPVQEKRFADGKAEGLWKFWYDSGEKLREANYKAGKLEGLTTEWHKDGSKRAEANFADGKRDGLSVNWRADGEVIERNYKQGKLVLANE